MILLFIGVYAVLAILVYIMFKVLKGSVDKIGDQSKTYFVDKLQEYDELILKKEEKLNDLNEEIKNKKVEAEEIKKDINTKNVDFDVSIIDVLSRTKYQDSSILELEKYIDEEFDYDKEKIIKEFIKNVGDVKNYEFCRNLRKKFTPDTIYNLQTLPKSDMFNYLETMLSEDENKVLNVYKDMYPKFKIKEFMTYLDELVMINDPTIVVYVGSKNENYDYLGKTVKTKIDNNIFRGIKIGYQGRIYDFSLDGRNM